MSLRSRVGNSLVRVGKTFGGTVPAQMLAGEEASEMTPASPFSPGTPVQPFDGYERQPRAHDFTTGYNIAARPRVHERVSFEVLKGLISSYDVADICIWHRIDSIRSLKWKLIAADHYFGDVTSAIPLGLAALQKPDRKHHLKTWLAKYMYDILAYDAGTLYRMRNRGGRCVGLKVVDGTMIAPLLDYWGDSPEAPAEAYVQYANGLPWNWLTRDDIVYEPFRPHNDSPYGHAPIESVILNANTDIRFQVYFLDRFTAGNLPAAFASSPDSWSPDQIEQFQAYWDSFMFADQSQKHQIKWMPPGSKFEWSNEKDFSDQFSLFLMRKTCASFHVVPSDLGFTENVNRSSGESQADVQHRVGDLPLMEHVEDILSSFLLDDVGLPLQFEFDRGEEQVDQAAQAEADQKYMDRAVISSSEIREMRYGLVDTKPVPRVFFTERAGPIPLSSLEAVAGAVDPQTAAPEPGSPLPHTVFEGAPGVQPNPALYGESLAEEIYGPSAIPADAQTSRGGAVTSAPVAKEGEAPGITTETGLTSYDLVRDDEDETPDPVLVAKAELAAFRRFEKARRRSGEWRDFEFRAVAADEGTRLNAAGRQAVRKDVTSAVFTHMSVQRGDDVARFALGCQEGIAECCQDGGCCGGESGCGCGPAGIAKAGGSSAAPKAPALDVKNLTGVWAEIYGRREKLLREHLKAVAAAWDACLADLDTGELAREFRAKAGTVAKLADPHAKWWKDAGTAAALAWLLRLSKTKGYPALVAALEDAIRSGMAQGEADALALAADRQGAAGFQVERAFRAAYDRLAGDAKVAQQAQDAATGMADGAAGDAGRALAGQAGDDGSEDDMASAVDDALSGDESQSVGLGVDWWLWSGIGAGALALYQMAGVQLYDWIDVGDERECQTCLTNAAGSPYRLENFPDLPAHIRCRCSCSTADPLPLSFLAAFLD